MNLTRYKTEGLLMGLICVALLPIAACTQATPPRSAEGLPGIRGATLPPPCIRGDALACVDRLATEGKLEEAIKQWLSHLQVDPNDARTRTKIARAYNLLGRGREADPHWEKAMALHSPFICNRTAFALRPHAELMRGILEGGGRPVIRLTHGPHPQKLLEIPVQGPLPKDVKFYLADGAHLPKGGDLIVNMRTSEKSLGQLIREGYAGFLVFESPEIKEPCGVLLRFKNSHEPVESVDLDKLQTYANRTWGIKVLHPPQWHIHSLESETEISVFISREKVMVPGDLYYVGVRIQSLKPGLDPRSVARHELQVARGKVISEKTIDVSGVSAVYFEYLHPPGDYALWGKPIRLTIEIHLVSIVVPHRDHTWLLKFEAKEREFERYRLLFTAMIASFSAGNKP